MIKDRVLLNLNRVEMIFWKSLAAISLPRLRKFRSLFFLAAVIILSTIPVRLAANKSNLLEDFDTALASYVKADTEGEKQGWDLNHDSLLLIIVDQLDRKPHLLDGVWIMINNSRTSSWQLFPVERYFNPSREGQIQAVTNRTFYSQGGKPTSRFLEELQSLGLRWDFYFVVDRAGLSSLAGLLGWVNPFDFHSSASVLTNGHNQLEPKSTHQKIISQAVYINRFCERSTEVVQNLDPETVLGLLKGHTRTDFDWKDLPNLWRNLKNRGFGFYCEFPTLGEGWSSFQSQ